MKKERETFLYIRNLLLLYVLPFCITYFGLSTDWFGLFKSEVPTETKRVPKVTKKVPKGPLAQSAQNVKDRRSAFLTKKYQCYKKLEESGAFFAGDYNKRGRSKAFLVKEPYLEFWFDCKRINKWKFGKTYTIKFGDKSLSYEFYLKEYTFGRFVEINQLWTGNLSKNFLSSNQNRVRVFTVLSEGRDTSDISLGRLKSPFNCTKLWEGPYSSSFERVLNCGSNGYELFFEVDQEGTIPYEPLRDTGLWF